MTGICSECTLPFEETLHPGPGPTEGICQLAHLVIRLVDLFETSRRRSSRDGPYVVRQAPNRSRNASSQQPTQQRREPCHQEREPDQEGNENTLGPVDMPLVVDQVEPVSRAVDDTDLDYGSIEGRLMSPGAQMPQLGALVVDLVQRYDQPLDVSGRGRGRRRVTEPGIEEELKFLIQGRVEKCGLHSLHCEPTGY